MERHCREVIGGKGGHSLVLVAVLPVSPMVELCWPSLPPDPCKATCMVCLSWNSEATCTVCLSWNSGAQRAHTPVLSLSRCLGKGQSAWGEDQSQLLLLPIGCR